MFGVGIGEALVYGGLFISLYFEVFMLTSFIHAMRTRRTRMQYSGEHAQSADGVLRADAALPSVTVIVPCWNEEKTLAATMESLLALEYPQEKLKFIIVDDGSKDNTLAVGRTFESPRVMVLHKENGGKHSAMNFALARVNTDLVGCLDADSIVAPDALTYMIPAFQDARVAAVTPGIVIKKPENLLQRMQDVEYRLGIFNRFTLAALGSQSITPGPFSIFRAAIVKESGGWRYGHSTEDFEIALRLQEKGYIIGNAPRAIVHTGTPRTIGALMKQRTRWSYGFLRNALDYRHMFANTKYGILSLFLLPINLVTIFIAIFFFGDILYNLIILIIHEFTYYQVVGIHFATPSFNWFYFNTNIIIFLTFASVSMILTAMSIGTMLSMRTNRLPSFNTVLFVAFYGFLAPWWLLAAVVRAFLKTGVKWR